MPKQPSDCQLQEAGKKTLIGPQLLQRRQSASLHTARPGSLQAKQLHHLHTQLSLGQSCHRQNKSCIYAHRITSVVSNCLHPRRLWSASLFCQGGSPDKNTGVYWPILVAIPFLVQFSSVAQSCPTLCDPKNCSSPDLPVYHQLPEPTQTHVH